MQEIKNIKIDKLKPYENNAKIHTEYQVDLITKSIEQFGFINPVLIDENKNVIAGHGRIEAAKKLNMQEVPTITIEGLSDDERKAYILADNKLSELAEWDNKLIAQELKDLQDLGFNTEVTGFSAEDIDFSFLDEKKEKSSTPKQRNRSEAEECECPRCKCIFKKNEIISHGEQSLET